MSHQYYVQGLIKINPACRAPIARDLNQTVHIYNTQLIVYSYNDDALL